MKYLLLLNLTIFTLNSFGQVKLKKPKRLQVFGKIVYSAFVDLNCNNKKDINEPLLNDFNVTHFHPNKKNIEKIGSIKIELDSLLMGIQNNFIVYEYSFQDKIYKFEKEENISIKNDITVKRLIAINTHCSNKPNHTMGVGVNTTSRKPSNIMYCDFTENFATLKSWKFKTNIKEFAIANEALQINVSSNYNALIKKMPKQLEPIFDASFDLYINNFEITTNNYFPLLFTEGESKLQDCKNAIGFLLKRDLAFGVARAPVYITPYQKVDTTEIIKLDWEFCIPIFKNKWYKIYFAKISEELFAIQAYDPALNDWSKKIVVKSKFNFEKLTHLQISSDAQPTLETNTKLTIDNICIKKQ